MNRLLILLLFPSVVFAQFIDLNWGLTTDNRRIDNINTDIEGNIYSLGVKDDNGACIESQIPYFNKYDSEGVLIWSNELAVHQCVSNYPDGAGVINDIAFSEDYIYITGTFRGNFQIPGYCGNNTSLTIESYENMGSGNYAQVYWSTFYAKYNYEGDIEWLKVFDDSWAYDHQEGISIEEVDGYLYLMIGIGNGAQTKLAKVDLDGNVLWDTTYSKAPLEMKKTSDDNLVIMSHVVNNDFNGMLNGEYVTIPVGSLVLYKLGLDGVLLWYNYIENASPLSTGGANNFNRLSINENSITVCGSTSDSFSGINLSGEYIPQLYDAWGNMNIIARYNYAGNLLWHKPLYSSYDMQGITTDEEGSVYCMGPISSNIDQNINQSISLIIDSDTINTSSVYGVYLMKLDDDGDYIWSEVFDSGSNNGNGWLFFRNIVFSQDNQSILIAGDTGASGSFVFEDFNHSGQAWFLINLDTGEEVFGCTDSSAVNFDPDATEDDGSCLLNCSVLEVGMYYQGGIVFYIDDDNEIIYIVSNEEPIWGSWGCAGLGVFSDWFIEENALIGAGSSNTEILYNADCSNAAEICYNLELNGYNDWYLPSEGEFFLIHDNLGSIPGQTDLLYELELQQFWTSTEYNTMQAIEYAYGISNIENKTVNNYILPIRSTSCLSSFGLCGDVNLDEQVNSQDAALILQFIVGLTDLDEEGIQNGDVNNNGSLNSQDAALILQHVVGLIDELTCD